MAKDVIKATLAALIIVGIVIGLALWLRPSWLFTPTPPGQRFDASHEKIWPPDGTSLASLWPDTHNVKMTPEGQDLRIVAGNDPMLQTALNLKLGAYPYLMKVVIEEPVANTFQLFFVRAERPYAVEQDSVSIPVVQGWNTLYVPIGQPQGVIGFRLDPGTVQGQYLLRQTELRKVD